MAASVPYGTKRAVQLCFLFCRGICELHEHEPATPHSLAALTEIGKSTPYWYGWIIGFLKVHYLDGRGASLEQREVDLAVSVFNGSRCFIAYMTPDGLGFEIRFSIFTAPP